MESSRDPKVGREGTIVLLLGSKCVSRESVIRTMVPSCSHILEMERAMKAEGVGRAADAA